MQPRYVLFAFVALLIFGLVLWMRSRNVSSSIPAAATTQQISLADLTDGEKHIYDLLHEVQGKAILTENFVRDDGDAKISLTMDTNKTTLSTLTVNLSSLARKQKSDGLSDGAVKRGFVFSPSDFKTPQP